MKEIPTAEEFLKLKDAPQYGKYWENLLIEFAKLHVEAQREAIKEKAKIKTQYFDEDIGMTKLRQILNESPLASERTDQDGLLVAVDTYEIDKKSINDAYPLNNVK